MNYDIIAPIAVAVLSQLAPYCERAEIAGSVRRRKSECNDIEIVIIPRSKDLQALADTITLLALNGAIDVFTPFSNSSLSLEWEGASATAYGVIANQLGESGATFETAWNPSFDCTYDSAAADTPLQLIPRDAGTTDPTHLLLNLDILSFTTP